MTCNGKTRAVTQRCQLRLEDYQTPGRMPSRDKRPALPLPLTGPHTAEVVTRGSFEAFQPCGRVARVDASLRTAACLARVFMFGQGIDRILDEGVVPARWQRADFSSTYTGGRSTGGCRWWPSTRCPSSSLPRPGPQSRPGRVPLPGAITSTSSAGWPTCSWCSRRCWAGGG
jgi:hypothetical protein